nr:MAG TPA: hypothetical protein [Caudoviricetes sp.]
MSLNRFLTFLVEKRWHFEHSDNIERIGSTILNAKIRALDSASL